MSNIIYTLVHCIYILKFQCGVTRKIDRMHTHNSDSPSAHLAATDEQISFEDIFSFGIS